MKKYLLLSLIGGLFASNLFAQSHKVADLNSFKYYLTEQSNVRNSAADLKEIRLADGREFLFLINKKEVFQNRSLYYGVLQAPLKGGVYISVEGDVVSGEIIQSDINKVTRFESKAGDVYLTDDNFSKVLCDDRELEKPVQEKEVNPTDNHRVAATVDTRKLQSYPGATGVIYIDFDGGWSGQRWANSYTNGVQFYLTPAGISADNELTIFQVMSEDFKAFNINVTTDSTVFLQYATNRRQRLIVTRNDSWQTLSTTGIAWINGFSTGDDPCFSFPDGFSSSAVLSATAAGKLGEVSSHECGHTVGLSHDGATGASATNYYSGHGNWAPIMGSGYNRNVTQWSKGEYANANQLQDDLAIITSLTTNGFGYKNDDYGNVPVSAQLLVVASGGVVNAVSNNGVIEKSTDIDYFKFTTNGGQISLHFEAATPKPNLDIKASLYNSSNVLIASSDVANLTYADIATTLTAGTYYISVEGVGYADPLSTGYSKYATLGYYEISGNVGNTSIITVNITAPSNNALYPIAPASVNITADATVSSGTISKVEFYQGTTLIGTDPTSPYSFNWTNVPAGYYALIAIATDNLGSTDTSSIVNITVGNQRPVVAITSPLANASFSQPASITFQASASDPDGTVSRVEFYNGTTLLGTDLTSPYSYTWTNVPAGNYVITAKAYDNSTGVGVSSPLSVKVGNQNPVVLITSPAVNSTYSAPVNITINAIASDVDGTISKVDFYNGSTLVGTDASAPFLCVWNTVPVGTYTITAIAYDNLNAADTSTAVKFYVNSTCSAATWSSSTIYNAGDKASYNGRTYTANWWSQNNQPDLNTSSGQWTDNGVCAAANQLPVISITSPVTNAVAPTGSSIAFTVATSDPDGTIANVKYYAGTNLIGTTSVSPFGFTWTNLVAGTYSIVAVAQDNLGSSTTSAIVTVVVSPTTNLVDLDLGYRNGVYPNPTSGILNVGADVKKVEVFDVTGNVHPIMYVVGSGQVDLSSLAVGMYIVKIEKDSIVEFERIIKR